MQTAGKNLLITKDTALYRGLNRSVQYGDFIAKAVLYDHMAEQGVDQRTILDTLAEEFVNYNRLAGRGRDFLESIGLLWFFNYKLRIQKVLLNTIRERPVSFGLFAGGVGPWLDVDTILSGSGFGAWWDNRIGCSSRAT